MPIYNQMNIGKIWSLGQMGEELIRVTDRKKAGYALSPTAEEIISQTVNNMVTSYKQLPMNLYQIQTKFP